MGYYLTFATQRGDLGEADDVASNGGWAAFTSWALAQLPGADFRETRYLAWYGESDRPQQLQDELGRILADKPGAPSPDILHTGQRLLAILRGLPGDLASIMVTDGTQGGDEDAQRPPRVAPSRFGPLGVKALPGSLYSASGQLLGRITTEPGGRQLLYAASGDYRGSYDPASDVTLTASGQPVGRGNLLGMLLVLLCPSP